MCTQCFEQLYHTVTHRHKILLMLLNNGDNQNKKAWESRMFCTLKATHHALQNEAFFIVTVVVIHTQNLDV